MNAFAVQHVVAVVSANRSRGTLGQSSVEFHNPREKISFLFAPPPLGPPLEHGSFLLLPFDVICRCVGRAGPGHGAVSGGHSGPNICQRVCEWVGKQCGREKTRESRGWRTGSRGRPPVSQFVLHVNERCFLVMSAPGMNRNVIVTLFLRTGQWALRLCASQCISLSCAAGEGHGVSVDGCDGCAGLALRRIKRTPLACRLRGQCVGSRGLGSSTVG